MLPLSLLLYFLSNLTILYFHLRLGTSSIPNTHTNTLGEGGQANTRTHTDEPARASQSSQSRQPSVPALSLVASPATCLVNILRFFCGLQ